MQLSQKKKNVSNYFDEFLTSILNFEYFWKKDDSHSLYTLEITDSKKHG